MTSQIVHPEGINRLLDTIIEKAQLKNDAALARKLEVAPPVISKLRHGRLPLGNAMIIKIHEVFEIAVATIKQFGGVAK